MARRVARSVRPSKRPERAPARTKRDTRVPDRPAGAGVEPARESLTRALERGRPLEDAVLAQVRALVAADDADAALSIAESLRRREETRALGRLTAGIVAFRRGNVVLAWEELGGLPREVWARRAAGEYVRSGLAAAPDRTLADIRELVAARPADMPARSWFTVLGAVFGYGAADLARDVFAAFDRRVDERPGEWRDAAKHRDWMRPWIAADPDSATAPAPAGGRPAMAIMDYGHPGANRASANIGDHIQSLAALGHLVRHRGVRLHGEQDLVGLLTDLGERTRPELQRDDLEADLEVLTLHRDASMYSPVPEGTWVLCFGWYMHALFSMRHGFPLHRNLRPIFVSFHCNKRQLLTPAAVDYLRRYGPVGCRDWTTVFLLRSLDVPAFFSGCLTTTIGTLFRDLEQRPGKDAPVGYVDADPKDVPADAPTYRHSFGAVRERSFVVNVRDALRRLETYRRRHCRLLTSRLHCYLPARALGIDVDFRPANRSDVRLDGLIDITDEAFEAMRDGLTAKLEQMMEAILAGRPEDEVYGLWRALTAADVAAAERRSLEPHPLPVFPSALGKEVTSAVARTAVHEPAEAGAAVEPVDCAVILSPGQGRALITLARSLLEQTSRPLRLWVLALPGTRRGRPHLVEALEDVRLGFVPVGGLGAAVRRPDGGHPAPCELVPLVLADLLPDVDRVVVLPLPSVATGDVAELADLDLGGHALAAPKPHSTDAVSGFGLLHAAAARLKDRRDAASAMRRTAHVRHRFDFDAFTTDVLVMDLARLREDGLAAQAAPLVEAFGLRAVEALNYLVGPDRADVPERWAIVPTRTPCREPGLLHWADRVKPWQRELTPEREQWRRYAAPQAPPE